ncbi:MAG: hypothetical protein ACLVJC_01220 [Dorea formicigenerans]
MKILTGVYTKDAGTVIVDGQEVCYKNRRKLKRLESYLFIRN